MRILVLNGSPRPQRNKAEMVATFKKSAEKAGHKVAVINIYRKFIKWVLVSAATRLRLFRTEPCCYLYFSVSSVSLYQYIAG